MEQNSIEADEASRETKGFGLQFVRIAGMTPLQPCQNRMYNAPAGNTDAIWE